MQIVVIAIALLSVLVLAPIPVLLGVLVGRWSAYLIRRRQFSRIISEQRSGEFLTVSVAGATFKVDTDLKHLSKCFQASAIGLLPPFLAIAATTVFLWFVPWAPLWNSWVVAPVFDLHIAASLNSFVAVTCGLPVVFIASIDAMKLERQVAGIRRLILPALQSIHTNAGTQIAEALSNKIEVNALYERLTRKRDVFSIVAQLKAASAHWVTDSVLHGKADPQSAFGPIVDTSRNLRRQLGQAEAAYVSAMNDYHRAKYEVEQSDSIRLRDRIDACFEGLQSDELAACLLSERWAEYIGIVTSIGEELRAAQIEAQERLQENAFQKETHKGHHGHSNTTIIMDKATALQVLNLSSEAKVDEIKKTYKLLVKIYHPDGYPDDRLKNVAAEFMKKLNQAYDTLKKEMKF